MFEALSLEQQETIKAGGVERGFTGDMVYMSLGKPSAIEAGTEQGTPVEVWSYRNYRPGVYGKRKAGGASNMPESKGAGVFQSLPSEGGSHGDVSLMDNYDRRGSNSPSPPDEGPIFTLRILFVGGKVISTKLVP